MLGVFQPSLTKQASTRNICTFLLKSGSCRKTLTTAPPYEVLDFGGALHLPFIIPFPMHVIMFLHFRKRLSHNKTSFD